MRSIRLCTSPASAWKDSTRVSVACWLFIPPVAPVTPSVERGILAIVRSHRDGAVLQPALSSGLLELQVWRLSVVGIWRCPKRDVKSFKDKPKAPVSPGAVKSLMTVRWHTLPVALESANQPALAYLAHITDPGPCSLASRITTFFANRSHKIDGQFDTSLMTCKICTPGLPSAIILSQLSLVSPASSRLIHPDSSASTPTVRPRNPQLHVIGWLGNSTARRAT